MEPDQKQINNIVAERQRKQNVKDYQTKFFNKICKNTKGGKKR